MNGIWKYVGMAVGILVGIDFCRRGEWGWGIFAIVCVVGWVLFEAWGMTMEQEEAKEERAEERREKLANERRMRRMELKHQQHKPEATSQQSQPDPTPERCGDG